MEGHPSREDLTGRLPGPRGRIGRLTVFGSHSMSTVSSIAMTANLLRCRRAAGTPTYKRRLRLPAMTAAKRLVQLVRQGLQRGSGVTRQLAE
jgi:hypothetical protein